MTDISQRKVRTTRMLEYVRELAAHGYSLEKIEVLLHYAGYPDARQRLWWPILIRKVATAEERGQHQP